MYAQGPMETRGPAAQGNTSAPGPGRVAPTPPPSNFLTSSDVREPTLCSGLNRKLKSKF